MDSSVEEEVGTYEAKNRLSALVDAAARGKRIWITRHGKRVALLCSGIGTPHSAGADVIDELRAIRTRVTGGEVPLKDLVEEGRK